MPTIDEGDRTVFFDTGDFATLLTRVRPGVPDATVKGIVGSRRTEDLSGFALMSVTQFLFPDGDVRGGDVLQHRLHSGDLRRWRVKADPVDDLFEQHLVDLEPMPEEPIDGP